MKTIREDAYFQYGHTQPIRYYWLKRISFPFINAFYHTLLNLIPLKEEKHKYTLSLILIFKNEAPYLIEWLEYHLMLGVDHFYLYQNNSTDNYLSVLQPYIEKGIVTLIDWPEYPGQYSAYLNWYQNYRHESQWASFIDIDEFICPLGNMTLLDFLNQYKRYPVVLIYWKLFGTSGRLKHDAKKPVIEQYYCCRPKLFSEGKIFYNTRFDAASDFISMHGLVTRWHGINIQPVNSFGQFVLWDIHRTNGKNDPVIQLNHYWSKAFECWQQKYLKGSIEKGTRYKDYSFFEQLEEACTDTDYTIYRYLTKLKLKLTSAI